MLRRVEARRSERVSALARSAVASAATSEARSSAAAAAAISAAFSAARRRERSLCSSAANSVTFATSRVSRRELPWLPAPLSLLLHGASLVARVGAIDGGVGGGGGLAAGKGSAATTTVAGALRSEGEAARSRAFSSCSADAFDFAASKAASRLLIVSSCARSFLRALSFVWLISSVSAAICSSPAFSARRCCAHRVSS